MSCVGIDLAETSRVSALLAVAFVANGFKVVDCSEMTYFVTRKLVHVAFSLRRENENGPYDFSEIIESAKAKTCPTDRVVGDLQVAIAEDRLHGSFSFYLFEPTHKERHVEIMRLSMAFLAAGFEIISFREVENRNDGCRFHRFRMTVEQQPSGESYCYENFIRFMEANVGSGPKEVLDIWVVFRSDRTCNCFCYVPKQVGGSELAHSLSLADGKSIFPKK